MQWPLFSSPPLARGPPTPTDVVFFALLLSKRAQPTSRLVKPPLFLLNLLPLHYPSNTFFWRRRKPPRVKVGKIYPRKYNAMVVAGA